MVKLEKELWKFKKLKEAKTIDETNALLEQGWVLIEATVKDGKKSFVLGLEKSLEMQKVNLDDEIEKVIEKHERKYLPERQESEVHKTNSKAAEKSQSGKSEHAFKRLITGPVFLAAGVGIFFYAGTIQAALFGKEHSLVLDNIILFAAVILVLIGLVNIFLHVAKKEVSE